MTADELLLLARAGGSIVCSSQCTVEEIEKAKATGRFYTVPEKGTGYGWGMVYLAKEQVMNCSCEPGPATVGT